MISKARIFRISLAVFVISAVYKIQKTAAKLSMGVFSGTTPDILPFGVIQQMQTAQHVQGMTIGKSVIFPSKPFQDPMYSQTRRTSINLRRPNYIISKSRPPFRRQSLLGLSEQNIQLYHLYDDDGKHLLDLKVDKDEHPPSDKPKWSTNASHRRKSVLYPKQSSEGFKRIHHYWLYI